MRALLALLAVVAAGVSPAYGQCISGCGAGATQADLQALQASVPLFVNSGSYQTLSAILANYPCATPLLGRYGHVSDLYGGLSSTVVCEADSQAGYAWRPTRTDYAVTLTQTSGSVTLTPLTSAPIVYLQSSLTGGVTVTPGTTNVWVGATFHVYAPAAVGLGTITINGLVGGGTVSLLQGSDKLLTYTSAGWKSN